MLRSASRFWLTRPASSSMRKTRGPSTSWHCLSAEDSLRTKKPNEPPSSNKRRLMRRSGTLYKLRLEEKKSTLKNRLKQSAGSKLSSTRRIDSCGRSNSRICKETSTELKSAKRCKLMKSRGRSRFLPSARRKN